MIFLFKDFTLMIIIRKIIKNIVFNRFYLMPKIIYSKILDPIQMWPTRSRRAVRTR